MNTVGIAKHFLSMTIVTVLLFVACDAPKKRPVKSPPHNNEEQLNPEADNEKAPLIFSVHPYRPEDELEIMFTPLLNYLSKKLNTKIVLQIRHGLREPYKQDRP